MAYYSTDPLWMRARRERWSAGKMLAEYGVLYPPVPIMEIARWLGAAVNYTVRKDKTWSGALNSSEDPPQAYIWYRQSDSPTHQRFTVAHEIGHLVLHPLGVLYRDVSFDGNRQETQANKYAAALLMPRKLVALAAQLVEYDIRELARMFEVSEAAMEFRLKNLLIGPGVR